MSTYWIIATVLLLLCSPYLLRKNSKNQAGNPLPPGPLLRYAFLRDYPELVLDAWAKVYGPLYSFWLGDQMILVISDAKIAQDLLVNNSATFSSRKRYFIKNEVVLHDLAITATPYNATWRKHRRIAMQLLVPKAVDKYLHVLDYEANILVRSLFVESQSCSKPVNPAHSAARFTLNNMLTVSFGMRTKSNQDPLIEKIQNLVSEFDDITGPLSNAVDFIKAMQYLPTSLKSRGHKLNQDINTVYGEMVDQIRRKLQAEEPVPDCLVKSLLENQESEKLSDEDICMIAVVFAFGGVHSISAIIQWCIAFMATHPDVARRAHEEMDSVVGRDRWPDVDDEAQLPYVRSIIKELQRLHAPFWIPTPHYSTADSVYNGFFIPKDTVVVLNCWTIHHNPERYPDPFTFNPDRYQGDDHSCAESSRLPNGMKRDHWTFGAGRRICPGLAVAEKELWLAISRLIWSFTFAEVPGSPMSLQEYEGSSGRTPLPFQVALSTRHPGVASLMEVEERATCLHF